MSASEDKQPRDEADRNRPHGWAGDIDPASVVRSPAESGLVEHFANTLGVQTAAQVVEHGGPVTVLRYLTFDTGLVHYATLGAGAYLGGSSADVEVVVSLPPRQEEWGVALIRAALHAASQSPEIAFGSWVDFGGPMVEGMPAVGLMFGPSTWSENLNIAVVPGGSRRILTVVPLSVEDVNFLRTNGIDAYFDHVDANPREVADYHDLARTGLI